MCRTNLDEGPVSFRMSGDRREACGSSSAVGRRCGPGFPKPHAVNADIARRTRGVCRDMSEVTGGQRCGAVTLEVAAAGSHRVDDR